MKVSRIIDGKTIEIELTKDELLEAHNEQEHIWDVSYCSSMLNNMDEESVTAEYGVSKAVAADNIDAIAYEMRRQINKYDLDADYARDVAYTEVLSKVREDLDENF